MNYKRNDILKALVDKFKYESYLEIGVESGVSWAAVKTPIKVGVDPDPNSFATINMTSDHFFKTNYQTFDLFFVDGLHEFNQVRRDIGNCLAYANKGFTIVCHDMLPKSEDSTSGDCWKAFVAYRMAASALEMFTVNTDHGIGIIRSGNQNLLKTDLEVNYDNFDKNRDEWMNVISVEEFKTWLNGE